MLRSISFILLISICMCSVSGSDIQCVEKYSYLIDPDLHRTPCQLIESRGFKCEEHFVQTKDGYILSVQRVVNPVLKGKPLKKPYILQHGLFGSSAHFLINAPGGNAADWTALDLSDRILKIEGKNLAYLLANFGYDIWLPNSRGNKYSTNHTTLNPDEFGSQFWEFSFDQMIAYDAPAVISHVLNETNSTTVGWIGHSQGTTIMFGLLSEQPEYADKVKPFIALAPVAYVTDIETPLKILAKSSLLKKMWNMFPHRLIFPEELLNKMAEDCNEDENDLACSAPLFLAPGYDQKQLNITRLPVYMEQGYAGTSNWNLLHYAYNIDDEGFYKFNYGWLGNFAHYSSFSPPAYDLSKIKSDSIYFCTSVKDSFADPKDVQTLKKSLKVKLREEYNIPKPGFSHLSFLWAENVYPLLYKKILEIMANFK